METQSARHRRHGLERHGIQNVDLEYWNLPAPRVYEEAIRRREGRRADPYRVGQRMKIAHTRALVDAALSGAVNEAPAVRDSTFGIAVPTACPGVSAENFKAYADHVGDEVRAAGPTVHR